jgi:SAM-dependent methyltransferase
MSSLKSLVRGALSAGAKVLAQWEYRNQRFERFNERPIEFAFVFGAIRNSYPKRVLDVGTGTTALPHLMRNCGLLVTAVDNIRDYWPAGMVNRHYHVIDDDIRATKVHGEFDLVTCVSVLEHIVEHDAAVAGMVSRLAPGGDLIITCPYTDDAYIPNVYDLPGSAYGQNAPYRTQSYSRQDIERWMTTHRLALAEAQYWRCWTGAAWTVGTQVLPPEQTTRDAPHQLACFRFRRASS